MYTKDIFPPVKHSCLARENVYFVGKCDAFHLKFLLPYCALARCPNLHTV